MQYLPWPQVPKVHPELLRHRSYDVIYSDFIVATAKAVSISVLYSQESHTRYFPHRKVFPHMNLLPQLPRSGRPYWEPFLSARHTLKHRTILLSKTTVCRPHRPDHYPSQLSGVSQPVLKR